MQSKRNVQDSEGWSALDTTWYQSERSIVIYCVSRINLCTTSALQGTICPRVLFTGLKPNYRKELSLAFGDYVELYTGTDNMSRERSTPCVTYNPELTNVLNLRKLKNHRF
jgi:hypothetical protein